MGKKALKVVLNQLVEDGFFGAPPLVVDGFSRRRKALRDLDHEKPEPPRVPRLLYADATPEALAYGLAKQWPSGGVVSAEAGIVFGAHGMGKDSVMRNLALLNVLWDGGNLTIDRRTSESPPTLPLTVEAKELWVAFHDAIEEALRTGGELYDVRDVASKTADNAARMAALFQVFEQGMGGAVGLEAFEAASLGLEAFEAASRIVAWHLNDARRFFGELALPAELANAARLDRWLIDYCRRERTHIVPTKKVQQFGPGGLRVRLWHYLSPKTLARVTGFIDEWITTLPKKKRYRLR